MHLETIKSDTTKYLILLFMFFCGLLTVWFLTEARYWISLFMIAVFVLSLIILALRKSFFLDKKGYKISFKVLNFSFVSKSVHFQNELKHIEVSRDDDGTGDVAGNFYSIKFMVGDLILTERIWEFDSVSHIKLERKLKKYYEL